MIPVEIAEPSLCRITFEEQGNAEARVAELDLIEEEQELTKIREEAMKLNIVQKYDKRVRPINFTEGDLILRKIEPQRKSAGEGKLTPKWEGAY
ncbi:hypothetical protein Cni_G10296 [Canna indica]|uniref:Uncharacterized protein n=1 Tax=Canna indica TaxID=4628 RepID=A0AAQ3K5I9_9LILI|nr:hypothetical protein Cni_G10296 [Canna indica]